VPGRAGTSDNRFLAGLETLVMGFAAAKISNRDISGEMPMTKSKKPTDWRKRFRSAKAPHVVVLSSPFGGAPPGSSMLISSPDEIAQYLLSIPRGETQTISGLRNDLARRAQADATCPVSTSIFLRVVSEVALDDMEAGKSMDEVAPFWRVIEPKDKIAAKLSCGAARVEHLRALDAGRESTSSFRPDLTAASRPAASSAA
jgi:hypothetical protein